MHGIIIIRLLFVSFSRLPSFVSLRQQAALLGEADEPFKRALSRVSKSLNSRTSLAVGGTQLFKHFGGLLRLTPPVEGVFRTTEVSQYCNQVPLYLILKITLRNQNFLKLRYLVRFLIGWSDSNKNQGFGGISAFFSIFKLEFFLM